MFNTTLKKKRLVGLVLLAVLLGLFSWFNRIPKLDTVQSDLVSATASAGQCFQGLCIDDAPEKSLLDRWWDFSLTYLKLIALGMTFAFMIAGLTHAFLLPPEAGSAWSARGIKGSLRGLVIGPAMNLCSACIIPISSAFRRRGAGVETTVAIVQGSSTLNLPALIMAVMVFPPVLAGSRIGLSLVGALLLGPFVAFVVRRRPDSTVQPISIDPPVAAEIQSWRQVIRVGLRDWLTTSFGYLVGLGPIMVLAGFASGFAIQWIRPNTVETFLGNDLLGVATAATLGLLINVPLVFEIPLVAALLLVGMGTAPAAVLLFTAAAGGPITFWGLAKVFPKRTILVFAGATWGLAAIAGLTILALGPLLGVGQPDVVQLAAASESDCRSCLLRDAIEKASNGDTIQIPAGVYTLEGGELIIKKNLTLEGAGAATTIIQAAVAPGIASHRVMNIPFGREVSVSGLTIRHGLVDSTEPRHVLFPGTGSGMAAVPIEFGGGIHVHGILLLSDSVVTGNQAGGGGGIFNGGILTLSNTIIESNTATASGGGIYNGGILEVLDAGLISNRAGSGGGIFNVGILTVKRSTIRGNVTKHGGGGVQNSTIGVSHLEYTTVNENTSASGGGIRNVGRLTLDNSTVSGNTGTRGGGVLNEGYIRISNTTVSGNRGKYGGGISVFQPSGIPTTEMTNTIIAANQASLEGTDCYGRVTSMGHNLLGSEDHCSMHATTSDLIGTRSRPVDPRLGALGNNGGPTETHALLSGSPAIDTGGDGPDLSTDQRGLVRPHGRASDIGAYERGS